MNPCTRRILLIRILIADDHDLFRAGLRMLIATQDDMKVVGEAGTGRETIALCKRVIPDVLLLDLDMPDIDGIEVTQQITAALPDMRVLVLTMYDSEDYAMQLTRCGAAGYIVKGTSPKDLPEAIRIVAGGEEYISPHLAEKILFEEKRFRKEDPLDLLSAREIQVLGKLALGHSVRDIAEELGLSVKTVETYKRRTMHKLDLRNISDITRFAIKHDLIKNF